MNDGPYRSGVPTATIEEPVATPGELRTWMSSRVCPACKVNLFGAKKDGYRIDCCGRCGGAWLTHEQTRKMIEERTELLVQLSETAAGAATSKQSVSLGRPCPDCNAPLERVRIDPCEVDTCKLHGTWFDPHELRAATAVVLRRVHGAEIASQVEADPAALEADAATRKLVIDTAGIVLGLLGALFHPRR